MIDKHNNCPSALHIARQEGNQQNKSIADYLWDDDHKTLLVTFSDN